MAIIIDHSPLKQPMQVLIDWLLNVPNPETYISTLQDFRALFQDHNLSDGAFKVLLSRAVKKGYLKKICRNLYMHPQVKNCEDFPVLYRAASYLRSHEFNYAVVGYPSEKRIYVRSSGRSTTISCGDFGIIEFIHTDQKPESCLEKLTYDKKYGMWVCKEEISIIDLCR